MNLGQMRGGGVIPAVVTPFGPDGSVDYLMLERLTSRLAEQGVHGIMATDGTGEFPHLSHEKRMQATRAIVSSAVGRIPVIAGTAACATRDALRLAGQAVSLAATTTSMLPRAPGEGCRRPRPRFAQVPGRPVTDSGDGGWRRACRIVLVDPRRMP